MYVGEVSAGQHLHLSGDLKGNVSIAAQQGMHFSQNNSSQSQHAQNNTQHSQQSPLSNPQHQNSPMQNNMNPQHGQNPMSHQSSPQMGSTMLSGNQQIPGAQLGSQQGPMGGSMQGPGGLPNPGGIPGTGNISGGNMGVPNNNMGQSGNLGGPTGNMGGPGSNMGGPGNMPGSMGGMQHPGMHVGGMGGNHTDSYSLSQTQTINFTQQSLRRAAGPGGVPNPMGPTVPMGPGPMGGQGNMGPRLLNAQTIEQQKLIHQQQILRAQQQAAMQQQMVRPPPPDYKTSAGMMQGVQPRYASAPPTIRRMPHQPMPPSGPMIRSNMYMIQQQQQQQHQQQIPQRAAIYTRQQGPMGSMDSVQHNSTEWRHLLMTQQQNSNFNSIRPNFQQGFNINSNNMQQMSAMQHQQIRTQQGMVTSGMAGSQQGMNQGMGQGQVLAPGSSPMAQINNMNQAMLHMQQQQQQSLLQQQNSQMSLSSIHMQQSQTITVTNQSIQQQGNMNNQLSNAQSNSQNNALSSFNPQADFNFEFLDNLASGDSGAFTDQELLNSFDSDAGFNLDF
ncbi:hypothetical protein NQ318_016897 [Aromia moschata]|uniref:Uncharacterized protein n=1 Tax=Aromia moschata TaxID=1265417 RepID=A0AAV8XQZ7_9CUCU|nr:hypothetical protein NQ318_016897 [Aromia moschata]